jgi:hypothetical protein
VAHEEFKTMGQVSSELLSIRQTLEARDTLDAERRKLDDARNTAATTDRKELLDRVNKHGLRVTTLETNWANFFGENGAFTYVKRKIDATDKQNRWIIGLVLSTLAGIIVTLVTKH